MKIKPGQILLSFIPFANGNVYRGNPRPYLVIEAENNKIKVLNISKIDGKIKKLQWHSNVVLHRSVPPLKCESFVKLDELYILDYIEEMERHVLKYRGVNKIDNYALEKVQYLFEDYWARFENDCHEIDVTKERFMELNPDIATAVQAAINNML